MSLRYSLVLEVLPTQFLVASTATDMAFKTSEIYSIFSLSTYLRQKWQIFKNFEKLPKKLRNDCVKFLKI